MPQERITQSFDPTEILPDPILPDPEQQTAEEELSPRPWQIMRTEGHLHQAEFFGETLRITDDQSSDSTVVRFNAPTTELMRLLKQSPTPGIVFFPGRSPYCPDRSVTANMIKRLNERVSRFTHGKLRNSSRV